MPPPFQTINSRGLFCQRLLFVVVSPQIVMCGLGSPLHNHCQTKMAHDISLIAFVHGICFAASKYFVWNRAICSSLFVNLTGCLCLFWTFEQFLTARLNVCVGDETESSFVLGLGHIWSICQHISGVQPRRCNFTWWSLDTFSSLLFKSHISLSALNTG